MRLVEMPKTGPCGRFSRPVRPSAHNTMEALMALRLGSVTPMKMRNLTTRVAGTAGPPLLTVKGRLDRIDLAQSPHIGRIARCTAGIGHGEAGANLAGEQRLEPLLFVHPIRSAPRLARAGYPERCSEDLGRKEAAPHDLGQRSVVAIVEPTPCSVSGRKRFHTPCALALGIQSVDDRGMRH